ncbi:GNAT family N-acetyltransferase [Streptomyces sp. NPDC087659]|uniref:GNAT family N-acetyltransferase n=1 Tax=Streptomyces sp. NPDC087659 TaxID=3365801 RepID=UPI0037F2BFC6
MTTVDVVGAAARAWGVAMAGLAAAVPGGVCEQASHGTLLALTGAPAAALNGVLSTGASPDAGEIDALAAKAREQVDQWGIQLRGMPDVETLRVAAEYGLTARSLHPFMIKSLAGKESVPIGVPRIRRVWGDEHATYSAMLAAGFEAPPATFSGIASRPVLDSPGMTAYLAERDGVAVATAFGVLVEDFVGVFNISTPPQHRGRGYGRAVTEAVLRDGREAGARAAFLHSSPAGLSLYESLGFRAREHWTHFMPA